MTRQEAANKCLNVGENDVDAARLLACLEALGLIKFDDQDQKLIIHDVNGYTHEIKVKVAIRALKAYGYEVVRGE